ncbi:MAG TPA: hypothetical protein VF331_14280 [Polyangiales bacterium]|jgi:protein TonB
MSSLQLTAARMDPLRELIINARRDRPWLWFAFAIAAAGHAAVGLWVSQRSAVRRPAAAPIVNELFELEPPEPTANQPPPEPRAPEPAPAPKLRAAAAMKAAPSPPALAQAAAIVTKQDEPDEPVDLTGFVTGTAATYGGGTTAANATGNSPGRAHAELKGTATGKGMAADGDASDRSQPPGVVGELDWHCPFPPEADADRIDEALATIRVAVDKAGRLTRVDVLQDPAHGFGGAARRCALDKSWRAARDRDGMPVAASVTVRVRFVR